MRIKINSLFKFVVLITFNIALMFLLGCGGISVSCDGNQKANNSNTSKYEILWYLGGVSKKDADIVNREISRYTKEKINASVRINMIDWANYDSKLRVVISSNEKFDLCITSAWINNYTYNVQRGAFLKLDTLLQKNGHGILEQLPSILINSVKINGNIYALPPNKDLAHQYAITFNKRLVNQYGFDISKISSIQDIEPMLEIIKNKEPNIIPYLICATECHAFSIPIERFDEQVPSGLYYDNRTNYKVVNIMECPELKEYLSLMSRWYKEGFILKDSDAIKSLEEFKVKGNWFSGVVSYSPSIESALSNTYGYDIEAVPLFRPYVTKKDISYYLQAISSTSKDPDRVMQFLDMLYTDAYLYNMVTCGVEGRHYTKSSKAIAIPTSLSYFVEPYIIGNMSLLYTRDSFSYSYRKDLDNFNRTAVMSPLIEFYFNKEPVKKEIEAITQVTEELEAPLFVGALDPIIYLPKVLEKYRAAGLDKVIEEQQRQLDTWVSTK